METKYFVTRKLVTDNETIITKVVPDAYGCDGIIPPGQTGEIHVTQHAYKSYELVQTFMNAFSTEPLDFGDGVPLFSSVHKDMSHTLTWKQRFVNWWRLMVR